MRGVAAQCKGHGYYHKGNQIVEKYGGSQGSRIEGRSCIAGGYQREDGKVDVDHGPQKISFHASETDPAFRDQEALPNLDYQSLKLVEQEKLIQQYRWHQNVQGDSLPYENLQDIVPEKLEMQQRGVMVGGKFDLYLYMLRQGSVEGKNHGGQIRQEAENFDDAK